MIRGATGSSSAKVSDWGDWYYLLDSNNFSDYSPALDGTGAVSGNWNIDILGNAATATTATTAGSATNDSAGNQISTTYAKLSGDTFTGAVNGTGFAASNYISANSTNSGTEGGLALYDINPTIYGIAIRGTGTESGQGGKHGYVIGNLSTYFYMTGNGRVSVKKSNDYVVRMIELAGGRYVFDGQAEDETGAGSTVNMTMEEFYAGARDADILIYNSAIDSPLNSLKELEDKSPLFASFKAVNAGEVWCTGKDMYQEITGVPETVEDLKAIISGEASGRDELQYMHRLR